MCLCFVHMLRVLLFVCLYVWCCVTEEIKVALNTCVCVCVCSPSLSLSLSLSSSLSVPHGAPFCLHWCCRAHISHILLCVCVSKGLWIVKVQLFCSALEKDEFTSHCRSISCKRSFILLLWCSVVSGVWLHLMTPLNLMYYSCFDFLFNCCSTMTFVDLKEFKV